MKTKESRVKKFFYKTNPRGISLIVLVITIIVIIILATAIIVSLVNNNPISEANRARYQSDRDNMQSIFTNTIAKIMAEKQEIISIEAGILNTKTSGVTSTTGDATYKLSDGVTTGKITFDDESSNDENQYYTGRKLPIYKMETVWHVDEEGILRLRVGNMEYTEEGDKESDGTTVKDPVIADKSGANAPNVSEIAQKTYVTWNLNEDGTEYEINDTQTTKPDYWYDYENGKWANIKTTNETEGLEAYWVWIPRYEYIVPTSAIETEIEVKFIPTSQTEPDKGYTIHPAFSSEGNGGLGELDGIWVAKFEASSNTTTPDTNYGGGNDTNLKVQVKPGVQSWRYIQTTNIFTVCRKMTNEGEVLAGSTVDSHMMKNVEWGAVAILSQSKYGIFNSQSSTGANGDSTYQIWNNSNGYNNYQNIYTGYAGNSKDASTTYNSTIAPTNVYEYNTISGTKASTTGTVYGIYDMAGGSWEYVAGCLNGQENAKFGVTVGDTKYVDLYENSSNSNSNYDGAKIGDATKETKEWNSDYSNFVDSSSPVFVRGRSLLLWFNCRCVCIQLQYRCCFQW